MRRGFLSSALLVALLAGANAFAVAANPAPSAQVNKIFTKGNRAMSAPPKSLWANPDDEESGPDEDIADITSAQPAPSKAERAAASVSAAGGQSYQRYLQNRSEVRRDVASSSFSGERRFGFGFTGGGAYGLMGLEMDYALNEIWSIGAGAGTGMAYSAWGLHSRLYMNMWERFLPFVQFGYTNWYAPREIKADAGASPGYILNRFMAGANGVVPADTRVHFIYPAMGVLYQMPSGLALLLQAQYFLHVPSFNGAMYGGGAFYYYF